MRQTIIEDLGQPPEALFREFAQAPIASASLAQVHEAVDHDGRHLAVKVRPLPGHAPPGAVIAPLCCALLLLLLTAASAACSCLVLLAAR